MAVGRLARSPETELVKLYVERAGAAGRALGLGPVEVVEVESRKPGKAAEAEALKPHLEGAHLIVCDEHGRARPSRAFAEEMVRDHTAVNDQALALVKKLGVTPQDNPTSQGLTKDATAKRTALAALSGKAFDKAYIDAEVAFHKTVNGALSGTLIPNARNPELKALLQTGLKLFTEHQQHAEQIAQGLK